ncbi:hypothetical protein Droror1_Dr00018921 [Drosera rotundifolia]
MVDDEALWRYGISMWLVPNLFGIAAVCSCLRAKKREVVDFVCSFLVGFGVLIVVQLELGTRSRVREVEVWLLVVAEVVLDVQTKPSRLRLELGKSRIEARIPSC